MWASLQSGEADGGAVGQMRALIQLLTSGLTAYNNFSF